LLVVAVHTKDNNLLSLLRRQLPHSSDDEWKSLLENAIPITKEILEIVARPLLDRIPVTSRSGLESGDTVRRAVERIGRNEPCPCGSGRKYKNCCYAEHQKRLHHSSDVRGVTIEELEAEPEPHMTAARFADLAPHDMKRLDPTKIPRKVLPAYLDRLAMLRMLDCAKDAFEAIGYQDDLEPEWNKLVLVAITEVNRTALEGLVNLRKPHGLDEGPLAMPIKLLLAENDHKRYLTHLSEAVIGAVEAQDAGNPSIFLDLAWWFAFSSYPGITILMMRATMPFLQRDRVGRVLWDRLYRIRDYLNLAPDDPVEPLLDTLNERKETAEEIASAIAKARKEAEAARAKLHDVQESMKQLQREIKRREGLAATQAAIPPPASLTDNRIEKELHKKIEFLTAEWKREHAEKNAYRRKSEAAEKTAAELREELEKAQSVKTEPAGDPEDDLLLSDEPERNQPIRLIEFQHGFQQRLNDSPRHIARAAMSTLGDIAAGEAAAFIGAKRLKICPEVMRQRFGDYRLLFQLLPDRVQVIDLVSRQDFERRIKTLPVSAAWTS
jgi:hypothetical protein